MIPDLQTRFVDALSRPPLDIPERIDWEGGESVWMMGTGLSRLETHLLNEHPPFDQFYVCDPSGKGEGDREREDEERFRYFDDRCLERLGQFQQGTFDLCIACWMIGTIPVTDSLSLLYRTLTGQGQIGLTAMQEGTPEEPLRLFKQTVREVTGKSVNLQGRGQLTGTSGFRSLITSLGFGDERVWKGDLVVSFDSPEEVFRILQQSAGSQWQDDLGEHREKLRDAFCEKLRERQGDQPEIEYAYLGATARRKGG